MSSILLFCWLSLVLCSLAPPTMSFSHGASHAACLEMIPGHIRAHPLDPQHSYVSVYTSTSSYHPGQFITVTVRSSRDFMGFLLQARSVGDRKSRAGRSARMRTTRLGPLLVGGSWILTPPGTHTLHCLSEGDTVTHSDKHRKRYLSFVWRAPVIPVGDLRFHITVVQSYFVYWAGIESAVVRDASHRGWRGSNTTAVDELSTIFAVQEEKVTDLPAVRAQKASKKQINRTASSATTPETIRGTDIHKSLITLTKVNHPVVDLNSSLNLTSHAESETKISTSGSPQSNTRTTPASLSGGSEETVIDPVSPTKDPLSFTSTTSSADVRRMDATATVFPNITVQNSTNCHSLLNCLVPLFPLNDAEVERKELQINSQEPKQNANLENKATTLTATTTTTRLISHSVDNTNTPGSTYSNPRGWIQEQKSSAKFETQNKSEELHGTILTESQMSTIKTKIGPHFQTYSSKPVLPHKFSNLEPFSASSISQDNPQSHKTVSQPENISSEPKSTSKHTSSPQTTTQLSSPLEPQSLSSIHQLLPETTSTQTQAQSSLVQTGLSQFETHPQVSRTPPQSQSRLLFQTGKTLNLSPVTPRPILSLSFTSRFDPVLPLEKDLKSQANTKSMSPVIGFVPSATPSPSFSSSSNLDPSTFHTSYIVHPGATTPLHQSGGSTLVSLRSTLTIHSTSSSLKNQPKTAPAFSPLPSPYPISTPPHLSSTQPSSSSSLPSLFTSSTIYSTKSSNYPSSTPLSSIPKSNSSLCVRSSNCSSPSSTTESLALSSSSATSILLASSSISPPLSFSSTSTSTSSSNIEDFTSPVISSVTSPHSGPSPALHLNTPLKSLVPSQKITPGQTLLIQTHIPPFNPEPDLNVSSPRTVVHPNPKPYPNLRVNHGQEFKPNIPSTDIKPKRPSNPPETPEKEGKYPDIIPRHSTWELGILLGCSAGLGMVLMVGVRYMYRQACGRRTEVTLNDREREYGRGERGLIQVQECGDLVRVRKIRENSFVLLTEYDVLASPGN